MRGRGQSAGKWDSGGLDVHDILDAVLEAVRLYPTEVDAANLNIVGYSGGGGNAIACAVRFPDFFRTCVSFFGISDYAAWHRSKGRPDCNAVMERAIGGSPETTPEAYEARNAIPAAGNVLARVHCFWDEAESQCPPQPMVEFLEACGQAGGGRAVAHVSQPADSVRWRHGYRSGIPGLAAADAVFLPDVLVAGASAPQLPKTGRLVVPGYLVTRHFSVWIADAKKGRVEGRVTIEYDLTGSTPAVRVVENPRNYGVTVEAAAGILGRKTEGKR
jgi:pimeloyl-ACP methyl ester carboxylesterase